jgi:hypothetical protein
MRRQQRTPSQASPSALLGSYVAELKRWAAGIATGYALAMAMLVAGAFSIAVALGIGVAALFHWLEVHYGPYVAYGALGGLFFLAGIASLLIGLRWLRRPLSPVPTPHRQARALKRAIAVPALSRAFTTVYAGNGAKPDKVTQALACAAAVTLLGWIATSYVRRSSTVGRGAK